MPHLKSPLALAILASALSPHLLAQQIVLPDDHHLCENPNQLGNVGSTLWWRSTTGGRFQILYEASHFLNAGVTGPILIERLRFRGEDGEYNLGGQVYNNVSVELGSTSLNASTLTSTFATNRAPATTTMGPPGVTNVALAPSQGSVPNNWNIDIDLAAIGAAIAFDPNGSQPNLLIDITMPLAPVQVPPQALIAMQDTTGSIATIRGRGVTTATFTAATGTLSSNPLVVGLQFSGPGGYGTIVPARNEFYGAGCGGSPSTFYQAFLNGQPWNLSGLLLIPDNPTAPNFYNVTASTVPVDLTKVNATPNSIADDALVTHPLGFTFAYPGGSTTTIKPCTNGFIWLDSAMTTAPFAPLVADLLGGTSVSGLTARLAPYWHDFNAGRNTGLNPQAGMHVLTDTSGGAGNAVCYVTWWDVGEFNSVSGTGIFGHAVWTMQCALHEIDGRVEFRYGAMPPFASASTTTANSNPAIVGFSRGRIGGINSVDPQSRDLSVEVPFATSIEGSLGNIGLRAVTTPVAGGPQYGGRLFPGQIATWNAVSIPPSALVGAQLLDFAGSSPGVFLPTIVAPGCIISTSLTPLIHEVFFLPGPTVTGTVPLPISSTYNPALLGFDLYAQFVLLDGLFTSAELVSGASNAIRHTIGLR